MWWGASWSALACMACAAGTFGRHSLTAQVDMQLQRTLSHLSCAAGQSCVVQGEEKEPGVGAW